ncbi:MAG TPA: HEPN domain-containing protein [Candidatus Kapabacteria bacterium]|nr:HEPN domain-containing protein [Candidatus Kapabacteria bacterium]
MTWKEDFMKYRREKAAQTLADARYLFEGKRLFSAVNRIYYALFYEVSVLLQVRNFSSPKHTGIIALFNKHFIKTGIVEVEIGKFYSQMFEFRQQGDYETMVVFEEEKIKRWLETAEKYMKTLEACIDNEMIKVCNEMNE